MAASLNDNDLETQICEMSNFLDKLVTSGEHETNLSVSPCLGYGVRSSPMQESLPSTSSGCMSDPLNSPFSSKSQMKVTSALAQRSNPRFGHSVSQQRPQKWGHHKQAEKDPDTSNIDIDATMMELGLTPDSLANNDVYRLFSSYRKLAFYINSPSFFDEIFEERTLPNTMNATVQTKHAIWSCNKLLRQLRETLYKYTRVPVEYQSAFIECQQSLNELHSAILQLDSFKFCNFEHRKGKFVSEEAREKINLFLEVFNKLIDCINKGRLYVDALAWALDKCETPEIEGAAAAVSSCGGPPYPVGIDESFAPMNAARPSVARRYIG